LHHPIEGVHLKTFLILFCLGAGFLLLAEDQPAAPRHIDFTQALKGVDGQTISSGKAAADGKTPVPMTLGDAALMSLETALEEDKQSTGADKFKLDDLARRIYGKKDVVLPIEDVATIKTRIGKAYGPMIVGAAWRLLDPAATEKVKP
jgi:hypothetical protein